jgi:transposase
VKIYLSWQMFANVSCGERRGSGRRRGGLGADASPLRTQCRPPLHSLGPTVAIVKRSDTATGFVVLPRRWVVEPTFAWLNRNRRLAKDFEATLESALARLFLASVKLLMRRLGRIPQPQILI